LVFGTRGEGYLIRILLVGFFEFDP
jgi:hypothetical protein